MKGFLIFGKLKRRRLAMTFGYECRPSFWRSVRSNSHLVIAGLGTASFLGIAGLALWLAMPSDDRSAFADTGQQEVAESHAAATPAESGAAAAPETTTHQAAPRGDEVTPETAAAEAQLPTLKPNNIRWTDPNAPNKPTPAASALASRQAVSAEAMAADAKPQEQGDTSPLAAFAAANRAQVGGNSDLPAIKTDKAATAAIPTAKPKTAAAKTAEAPNGHVVQAVTMRAGPKKGAQAMATVPADTAVQVISCKSWCEIVYGDKRGWVYKSFIKRD